MLLYRKLKIAIVVAVSSLKALTTPSSAATPSETTGNTNGTTSAPIPAPSGFMSAVAARKEREKAAQLEAAISSQLEVNLTLEQDRMEGVDDSEWVG